MKTVLFALSLIVSTHAHATSSEGEKMFAMGLRESSLRGVHLGNDFADMQFCYDNSGSLQLIVDSWDVYLLSKDGFTKSNISKTAFTSGDVLTDGDVQIAQGSVRNADKTWTSLRCAQLK